MKRALFLSVVLMAAVSGLAWGDGFIVPRPIPPDVEIPPDLSVKYHHVDVVIENQVARTTVDQVFVNHHRRDIEGTYIFPISPQASISAFSMFVGNEELQGKILARDDARRIYQEIVRRRQDPALLEYFGDGMFQASVYPIPARGEARIKLHYTEVLGRDSGLCEYRYTLGTERFSRDALESVELTIRIDSKTPITAIYSPSHDVRIERSGDRRAVVRYAEEGTRPDKDFLLYYTVSSDEVGVELVTFRDDDGDGYFMTLISPRAGLDAERTSAKDILFVLDTSGSMQGEKIEQAKAALSFCLRGLGGGDRFNVIDFDDEVRPFEPRLVSAERANVREALAFVEDCRAEGGTNINEALLTALRQSRASERTSFVIFLTDGLPTVGETDVQRILENVDRANRSETRLFVFGVGYDVNTRLLDRLAGDQHGVSDYVHPSEDIEVKVSQFFTKVSHPVLTRVSLDIDGVETYDVYPRELPDIFKGTELLVLGRYDGKGPATLTLRGWKDGAESRVVTRVKFSGGRRNDFIPRLWAQRKVGYLIDELRLHGKNEELVEEIVRLSKRYGIITEYTSFLVEADYRTGWRDLMTPARKKLAESNETEVGKAAVNRAQATDMFMQAPRALEVYKDEEGTEHRVTRIVQAGARTFYDKSGLWVDGKIDGDVETLKIKRFSNAYFALLDAAPEVGKYYALGDHVIFTLGGRAIEVSDEGKSELDGAELRSLSGR